MSFTLTQLKKKPLLLLYIGGVLLLLLGACLWFTKVSTDPARVFWGTVEQGLSTRGVTIRSEQAGNGTTVRQTLQYSLGATNLSHTLTTVSQAGTIVRNEMIGTPKVDYTRYVSIKTDQKRADGKDLDLSKIVGVWAKGDEGTSRLFEQAALGTSLPLGGMGLPIGYLNPQARKDLVAQMHNDSVYQVPFNKVKKGQEGGRSVYTYELTIQPVAYAALMKQFAKDVGLHGLDQLDPNAYKGQKPLVLEVTVDVRARQVVRVAVPGAEYKQTYTSYDVPVQLDLPKQTITASQLQELLVNLQ